MRPTICTTTQSPSIVIIQGAYQKLCAPASATVYANVCDFGFIVVSDEPVAAIATQEDWLRFQNLVAVWRQERGVMSSITEAAVRPAYQSIIGMGERAIPFLIATLQSEGDEPDQWFWALKAISGADPVSDEDRGNYRAMAASWVEWAKQTGYAW